MKNYPLENWLREATELYSAAALFLLASLALLMPHVLLLTDEIGKIAFIVLVTFSLVRFLQGIKIKRYQRRLRAMPYYGLSTRQVPHSKKYLFLGRGFLWTPLHTQRLHLIKQIHNQRYIQSGKIYQMARSFAACYPNAWMTKLLNAPSLLNPLRPQPLVGGKSYLHGLGNMDKPVRIGQDVRVGHTFVLGTTRVGKTRLASILINQDIRNGDAVIVVDPKGDLDLVRDMYSACLAANRLDDFKIVHLGYPSVSACYNPLNNFEQITEVATRVTDAIAAEGEGKQFADFAWKYVDIVVKTLVAMNQPVTYNEIGFYITRLDQLLMLYCDTVFSLENTQYLGCVVHILAEHESRVDKQGNPYPPMERAKAVLKYIKQYVSDLIQSGDIKKIQGSLIVELYDAASMDKQYYDKITASVGPVLAKINSSSASTIFSSVNSSCEVELMDVIKTKKVLYIGLDSLSNATVAQDVGKAFLSDLVSTAGKIYKDPHAHYRVNIHCDELSEIIQESFVKILNKAGGAGFQVTAYAQTKQDLEVALGSRAMAEMTEGNLNTIIMLRIKNTDTAKVLTDILPKVDVVSHTQVSMVNDMPHGKDGVYFNTTNEDRIQMTSIPMLEPSDVCELPKGQAFVLVNGGELYKIRIPLPINDGLAPRDTISAMRELNYGIIDDTEPSNAIGTFNTKPPEQNKEPKAFQPMCTPLVDSEPKDSPLLESEEEPPSSFERNKELPDFIQWLFKRMNSGNQQFAAHAQKLIKTSSEFEPHQIFVSGEILIKYEARSGIKASIIQSQLLSACNDARYFYQEEDALIELFSVMLPEPHNASTSSLIVKGEH